MVVMSALDILILCISAMHSALPILAVSFIAMQELMSLQSDADIRWEVMFEPCMALAQPVVANAIASPRAANLRDFIGVSCARAPMRASSEVNCEFRTTFQSIRIEHRAAAMGPACAVAPYFSNGSLASIQSVA